MFSTTVLKRLGGGSWNLVSFNINLCSIKKVIFSSLGYPVLPMATSLTGSTQDFLKLSLHMFPYNEILKVFESKSELIFEIGTSKYQIWAKSVRGFESYKHLNFRPMRRLKYRLWGHNHVIVVTSPIFCYHCVEYIKLDTCALTTKLWWGGGASCPSPHIWRFKKAHVK